MIPLFSRPSVLLSWFAACLLAVSALAPFTAEAQSASTKMRTVQPAAHHRPAKATFRGFNPWVPNPAVTGKDSYLLIDAATGRELASDRADDLRHPASLTKLMTLYLTFAALDSGRLSLGDALPVSASAHSAQPTKMGVPLGGSVTVRDAVMGLVTRSANDAAIVLAEAQGGDEASFARTMTQKARQLGMSSTVYHNASGLPNRDQVTTARDLARLASALLRDFPHYYALFSVQSYLYRGRPLENHNRMLLTYPGADGFKTGYTSASGFNLVMSATRDGRRLIGVVMGGDTASQRDREMADLMDRGFVTAQSMNLPAWNLSRSPSTPRYTAAQFAPGAALPEPSRNVAAVKPPAAPTNQPAPPVTVASLSGFANPSAATPEAPGTGSWVIQVGSFGDSRAAQQALERASAALPPELRAHSASSIDEVQAAQRTFHRARLINLTQDEAVDGCRRLSQRKIYCSAMQSTAWATSAAR
jgi:D-alanyl-D-alanine carboxypeptidase